MVLLCGHAGRLTAKNVGFRPGQWGNGDCNTDLGGPPRNATLWGVALGLGRIAPERLYYCSSAPYWYR
jgi:hypothetical protein